MYLFFIFYLKKLFFFSRQGSLLLQKGARKDPPYLSLTQLMNLSPPHWSGQGAHSFQLANLKQIVTGRRGTGGSEEGGPVKPEQNGVSKISFDRKDMLLSAVTSRNHYC